MSQLLIFELPKSSKIIPLYLRAHFACLMHIPMDLHALPLQYVTL